jgi:hypothetical protein
MRKDGTRRRRGLRVHVLSPSPFQSRTAYIPNSELKAGCRLNKVVWFRQHVALFGVEWNGREDENCKERAQRPGCTDLVITEIDIITRLIRTFVRRNTSLMRW